ncbi:MAG: hypothetical protein KIG95_01570 [Comamonas sp.]|nr:hypothetical protein [Comamonas sp.]
MVEKTFQRCEKHTDSKKEKRAGADGKAGQAGKASQRRYGAIYGAVGGGSGCCFSVLGEGLVEGLALIHSFALSSSGFLLLGRAKKSGERKFYAGVFPWFCRQFVPPIVFVRSL